MERGVKVVGAAPDDEDDDDEDTTADEAAFGRARRPLPPSAVPAGPRPARAARRSASWPSSPRSASSAPSSSASSSSRKSSGQVQDPAVAQRLADVPDRLLQLQRPRRSTRTSTPSPPWPPAPSRRRPTSSSTRPSARRSSRRLAESRGRSAISTCSSEGNPPGTASIYAVDRPGLRQQQDHHAPAPTSSASSPTCQGQRGLEDLQRDRARGRHPGQRQRGELRLGLGRLHRPRASSPARRPRPGRPAATAAAARRSTGPGCVRVCG